ncbi:hypothetical protein [Kordiimonas sp.]|uniref:hypothetical protein n=1 Tax=Kordiimonas sp. TaxID=1970157 RepID=UPI003A908DBA
MIFLVILGLVGLIAFYFAYQSRRTFTCPSCGEKIQTEYLDAQRCSVCGATLGKGKKDG